MAETKHPGTAGDTFTVVSKKHRASLTKEERRAVALHKMAEQADYEVANAQAVVVNAQKSLESKKAAADKAHADFEAAKNRLEVK